MAASVRAWARWILAGTAKLDPMRWQVIAGRIAAGVLLISALASLWVLWTDDSPPQVEFAARGKSYVVDQTLGSDPQLRRIRLGDALDVGALTRSERYEIFFGTIGRPIVYPLIDSAGRKYRVTLGPSHVYDSSPRHTITLLVSTLATLISVVVAGLLLLRRPGAIALTFAGYCAFTIPTVALGQAVGIPGGAFSAILQPIVWLLTAGLGPFALIAFALRFPTPFSGPIGKALTRASDAALVLAVPAILIFFDPFVTEWIYEAIASGISAAAIAVLLVVTTVRSTGADGLTRRRLGWVLIGSVLAAISVWLEDLNLSGPVLIVAIILAEALPLTVAYAVLRHRVMDLGFALNRTLVYGVLTATIVVAVSLIDWSVGKLLSQRQFATALEALVAVVFGVALNTVHDRIGSIVERVLFRERHIASQRLGERIRAIDFAESAATVDEVLTRECADILGLRSAAVFRSNGDPFFVRVAAIRWDGFATSLGRDDLIVRMIRAHETTLELAASGIVAENFPIGDACPDIAIPIVRRHRVTGVVFYGHRTGEAHLDPQERALLERAANAAANAYDALEAAEWRRDGHHLSPPEASRDKRAMRSGPRRQAVVPLTLPDPSAGSENEGDLA